MKKHAVAATWAFAVSLVVFLTLFHTAAEANTPLLDRGLSLTGLSSELKTPENITRYIWRHFLYEPDQRQFGTNEYWQEPEELLKNGRGDCEDFALFAQKILELNGIKSFLLNIYSDGSGHTVCVFQQDGQYAAIDGTNILYSKTDDLKTLMSQIDPFWKTGALVTADTADHSGRILTQISR